MSVVRRSAFWGVLEPRAAAARARLAGWMLGAGSGTAVAARSPVSLEQGRGCLVAFWLAGWTWLASSQSQAQLK